MRDAIEGNGSWSLIDGNLFRIPLLTPSDTIIKYDESKTDTYTLEETPCEVIKVKTQSYYTNKVNDIYCIIQKSFIPNFGAMIEQKLSALLEKLNDTDFYNGCIEFDSNHLHNNFMGRIQNGDKTKNGIYYPCDPRLIESINFLNKEVINNNKQRILATSWLIYQIHTNPTSWINGWKECTKDIPNDILYVGENALIPEEIQRIYSLEILTGKSKIEAPKKTSDVSDKKNFTSTNSTGATPTSQGDSTTKDSEPKTVKTPKSAVTMPAPVAPKSFWEAYTQKKLWEYTKQTFQAYKTKFLYGVGGVAAAGGAWWLWSKYGTTSSITAPKPQPTFSLNPK